MARAQTVAYPYGADYVKGSPHLKHRQLHCWLLGRMSCLVDAAFLDSGKCRVLEVGAGHGPFTEHLVAMGADVTVSELSKPSADFLSRRFRGLSSVHVVHDYDGEQIFDFSPNFDIVFCTSVLHHVPDYLSFVRRLTALLRAGGAIAAYQDPDWYPRRRRLDDAADRGAYFAWRITQGDLISGARTRVRRMQGRYDESRAEDMTEYHVVRQGVDDRALVEMLRVDFGQVRASYYWSTQSRPLQWLGEELRLRNTFCVEATARRIGDDGST